MVVVAAAPVCTAAAVFPSRNHTPRNRTMRPGPPNTNNRTPIPSWSVTILLLGFSVFAAALVVFRSREWDFLPPGVDAHSPAAVVWGGEPQRLWASSRVAASKQRLLWTTTLRGGELSKGTVEVDEEDEDDEEEEEDDEEEDDLKVSARAKSIDQEEDEEEDQEEDDEEEAASSLQPTKKTQHDSSATLAASALQSATKTKAQNAAKTLAVGKQAVNVQLQQSASAAVIGKKILSQPPKKAPFRIPYILRVAVHPITLFSMTRAFWASLFNLNYLQDQQQLVGGAASELRSALEEKAKRAPTLPSSSSNKGRRKMKRGQAKTIADLPQLNT